jgi:hypothetical protein
MAQTATQWLRKEVSKLGTRSRFYHDVMELIDEAEKKGEEQIRNAYNTGWDNAETYAEVSTDQYYNETYPTQAQ